MIGPWKIAEVLGPTMYKLEQIPGKFSCAQKPVITQVDRIKKYLPSDPIVTPPSTFKGNLTFDDSDLEYIKFDQKKDLKLNDDKDAQLDQETGVVAQAPWLPRIKHASHGQTCITAQRACLPKTMQPKNCSVQLAHLRKSAPRCVRLCQCPRLLARVVSKQQRLDLQRCREILAAKQRRVLNME